MHAKIAAQRADFLHKLSTEIAESHAVFCLEDLKVKKMSASAKGDIEVPGKNVRQKIGLNRSILDQGWSEWARQVQYKIEWRGGQVILVNPAYTSQRCSVCDYIHADNRNNEGFLCLSCGHAEHADVNAAKNILAAGLAVLAGAGANPEPSRADVEATVHQDRPVKRQPAITEEALCAV